MKGLSNVVTVIGMMAFVLGFSSSVFAQDGDALRSEKGFVKSVTKTEIVVTEYNRDKNAEVDVTYVLTPDTQGEIYGDIPVSQINTGDEVEIDYMMKGKKKIAEFVSVDLSSYE